MMARYTVASVMVDVLVDAGAPDANRFGLAASATASMSNVNVFR
jgi:hypothetical protein